MESRFISQDGMDNDAADLNTIQDYVQRSLDHVVGDGITSDRKYAGFGVAATATAQVTVQPGRLYSGGAVYNAANSLLQDFTTNLPVAAKKIAILTVWGTEADTSVAPREFLINEETGASQPRSVALEHARIANLGWAYSSESPDPVAPILDVGVLAVATVLLTPTGIASVTMNPANALDSVASVAARASALESFEATAAPQIVSLASDLAKLSTATSGLVSTSTYARALARLAVLEAKDGIPSNAADSSASFFLDTSDSDLTNPLFLAKVEEGIRFADLNANVSALTIFNPLDPNAAIMSGVLFPAYDRVQRMTVGPQQGQVQVSAYSYQVNTLVQKQMSRTRIRYGTAFTVCTNSAWWQSGQYDPISGVFTLNGETFQVTFTGQSANGTTAHEFLRVQQFWYDSVEEPYWEAVTTTYSVPGAQVAETFLNANDMWLDAVGVTFTQLAASGGVTLAICEVDRGAPDLSNVICKVDVDRTLLQLNAETVISTGPTFLKGGTRYAVVVTTAADHWLATTQGANFPQGTFFYVLDGAYQQGDATRDLCFSLYAAKFRQARTVIQLGSLSLAGGITNIDILASSIVPGSTDLTYEVQVGSNWLPLQAATVPALTAGGNIPPLLPLRAVFTGTPDVMPCVSLTTSQVTVSIPRTNLTHISTERDLPAPSSSIRVIGRLESYDPAHHTASCKLLDGAGFATAVNASSFVDVDNADGSIERTWLFNLGAAISSYKIEFTATTDSSLNVFHFAWRKDYAL